MAYTVVQSNLGFSNSSPGTTAAATWGSTTTAGNLLVCVVIAAAASTSTPTISTPTGWTVSVAQFGGTGGSNSDPKMASFIIPNASAASGSVSSTLGTAKNWLMYLIEVSGVATTSPQDQVATAGTSGLNPNVDCGTTAALSAATDFAIAVGCQRNNPTFSLPTNGFSILRQDTSGTVTLNGELGAFVSTKTLTASTAVNTGATSNLSNAYSGLTMTFKIASGGGSPQTVTPTGLGSAQSFGSPKENVAFSVTGLGSAQAFGTPTILKGPVTVSVSGLGSAQSFGAPTVTISNSPQTVTVTGLGSAQSFGTPRENIAFTVSGLGSAQAFGAIQTNMRISVGGVSSAQAFGALAAMDDMAQPGGLGSAQAFGAPNVTVQGQSTSNPALLVRHR